MLDFLVNKTLALGTIVSQIFIIISAVYFIFFRKKYNFITDFLGKYALFFVFGIVLISILGSIFYSNVIGFDPCSLCWFQRVFMYPIIVLLIVAFIKKDYKYIADYVLSLSIIGFLISFYHNYIYYIDSGLISLCHFLGDGSSCIKRYVFEFDYITIPLMSLTAFLLIIVFIIFHKIHNYDHR